MPIQKLRKFLDENDVKYTTIVHSQAFTAQEVAAAAHIPGEEMAKTVMLRVDGDMVMVVLPAPDHIHLDRLKEQLAAESIELAKEHEFKDLFPSCEVGAMPPFGNLWDIPVYVDDHLQEDDNIAFNAGSHTELVRLPYADFARLVHPQVLRLSVRG